MTILTLEHLSKTAVFLVQKIDTNKKATGTGLLVSGYGKYYLVTAEHVAKDMKGDGSFVIADDSDRPTIINWSDVVNLNGMNIPWHIHETADLAVVELSILGSIHENLLKLRMLPLSFISKDTAAPSRELTLTSFGYPLSIGVSNEHLSPLTFEAKASSGLVSLPRADINKICTFFVLNNPSVQGYSGAAVFDTSIIKVGAMTSTGSGTKCYGFIHGTVKDNTGGKMALVTPSFYLLSILNKINLVQNVGLENIPRNQKCHCGSGNRFKNCCGKL